MIRLRRVWVTLGVGLCVATAAGFVLAVAHAGSPRESSGNSPRDPASGEAGVPSVSTQANSAPTPVPTVRIVLKVFPPNRATVHWGKKNLGLIKPKAPLIIQRPRDSGPMDLLVRADGCVPVHTRAYTFTDSTVAVRVTPLDKKNTIYGYREVLPPDADGGTPASPGGPDGGAPL